MTTQGTTTQGTTTQTPTPPATSQAPLPAVQPLSIAIGLGAIAGVAALNAVALGVKAFPTMASTTAPAEMIVGANRFLAIVPAVAGGWIGEYVYSWMNPNDQSAESTNRALAMVAGAIGGVSIVGLLTIPAAVAPTTVVAGSRVLAAASGGAGAILGAYTYGVMSGEAVDMVRTSAVVGGVLGGVMAWNVVTEGYLGTIPYYMGSAVGAGQEFASATATAASRLYAVTAGSVGGLMAWAWTRPMPPAGAMR